MRVLLTCPEAASEVLPVLWNDARSETHELQLLFGLSRRNRSDAVYQAASRAFHDRSLSPDVRVTALGVLGVFLKPDLGLLLDFRPLTGLEPLTWDNVWYRGDVEHGRYVLSAEREAEIVSLVEMASNGDPDDKVRSSAWWLRSRLGLHSPD